MMMKYLFICLLLLSFSYVHSQDSTDEKTKIIQTLQTETSAYYKGDYQLWQDQWLHSEDVFHAWNKKDGTYFFAKGWENINEYIQSDMENRTEIIHPNFEIKDIKIHITDQIAYVLYDEYVANKENTHYTLAPGVKILKKDNNQWKLAGVNSYWNYTYDIPKSDLLKAGNSN